MIHEQPEPSPQPSSITCDVLVVGSGAGEHSTTSTRMRRAGRPAELAGPVVFLASSAASCMTGATLPVDGAT